MEIVLLLATIGQRFKFSLEPDHKVEVLPVLSLRPKNGIRVRVEELQRLTYTERIAKEAMRLDPPAYAVAREALEDTDLGGFRVPKGSQVFAFQWVTQRDARYFENPDAFDPDRWMPERSEKLPKYAYFPFGGGPRQCIGNYFAMMEIVLLLATIGQRFKFSLEPDQKVEVLPVLSLRPKNGIRVRVDKW